MSASSLPSALAETVSLFDETGTPWTTTEVANQLDLGRRSTYDRLERLVEHGRLETKRVGASARVWWRPSGSVASTEGDSGDPFDDTADVREVLERIDDGFLAIDGDWRFTYVNERAAELLDRAQDELIGEPVWDRFGEAVGTRFQAEYERARETGKTVSFEEYYPPLDSWFEVTAYPSESGLSVYFSEVTERRRRNRELERYETIIETVADGVYVVDDSGHFSMVNDAYAQMMGYSKAELVGEPVSKVAGEEVVERAAAVEEELAAGERETARLEGEIETNNDDTISAEAKFSLIQSGEHSVERVGVVRDTTERKKKERELQRRVKQGEAVADLGYQALEDRDVDELAAEAVERVADVLDADYCKVLEVDPDRGELLLRHGTGWRDGIVGEATVSAVEDDSQAAYTLATTEPVVVKDLTTESRFSGPDLLTDHDVRSGISVLIGPRDDPWGILGTHDTGRRTFPDHDVAFVQSVANILASATARREDEQALIDQRERIGALNNLNRTIREITNAVIEEPTREEIERTVCEELANAESYAFAWIGEVDVESQTVRLRTEAGVEGYLDDVTISVDPEDERSRGPTGRALRHGEVQTTQDIDTAENHDPWRGHLEQYSCRSSVAAPIVHENTTYGVLNIYADRPAAFQEWEQTVISQLGEVVGHAIAASNRKQALMSDEVVELAFRTDVGFGALDRDDERTGTVSFDHTVSLGDGAFLVFGDVDTAGVEMLETFVDSRSHWTDLTVRGDGDDLTFEARLSDPPLMSAFASMGGSVERAVIDEGQYYMTVQVPPSADIRQLIDVVTEAYPSANLLRRKQRPKDDEDTDIPGLGLTEQQRAALKTAFYSGFFEWPRDSDGTDVAESLGVSPPTFHQHLRKAERKVFETLFATSERVIQ